jgi:hypothetical protein
LRHSLFDGLSELRDGLKDRIIEYKDVSIYTGEILLKVDINPVETSLITLAPRALLNTATDDLARLREPLCDAR